MNTRTPLAVLACATALSVQAAGVQLDPGGTAFPYPAGRAVQAAGRNLAPDPSFENSGGKTPDGWSFGFHVHVPQFDEAKGKETRERVAPAAEMSVAANRARTGRHSVYLHLPGKVWRENDLLCTTRLSGSIPLTEDYPELAVQFAYKLQLEAPAPGNGRVMITCVDEKGVGLGQPRSVNLPAAADWTQRRVIIKPEKGARRLAIALILDRCGTAEYDDLAIFPTTPSDDKGLSIRCVPMQFLDGAFALSEGDASLICFGCKCVEKDLKTRDAHILISVPEGVRFTAWHGALTLEKTQHVQEGVERRSLFDFSCASLQDLFAGAEHDEKATLGLLIQHDLKAGAVVPPMRYWLEYSPGVNQPPVVTPATSLELKVLPPVRGRAPKDLELGVMLRRPSRNLGEGPQVTPYAEFIRRTGVNLIAAGAGYGVALQAHDMGLRAFSEGGLFNGYGLNGTHPKEVAFIRTDGEPAPRAICPAVVYRRDPYYVKNVYEAVIHRQIVVDKSADAFSTNWEPYMFFDKGCFCARCKREFIAFSKLPAEEVDKLWPLGIIKDRRAEWLRFSSWQHGRVIVTLDQDCKRAGQERGIAGAFIPQVTPVIFYPENKENTHTLLTDPAAYVNELSEYASWGGYWRFDYLAPETHPGVAGRLNLIKCVGDFRAWIDAHCPDGKRPKLHWLFHSYQRPRSVTFPEALTFDAVACYVLGMDAAWAYVFPVGYDSRYWQALSSAADTAAQFEPYLHDGRRLNRHALETVTPSPKAPAGDLLRSWEFERDGRRLFAIGNFWMDSESFFRIKPLDLDPAARYVVVEPREARYFESPSGRAYWTGAELAGGVVAHVGAMRWAFIEVRPADDAAPGVALTKRMIQSAVQERAPRIQAACDAAMREINAMARAADGDKGDYSAVKPVASGDLRTELKDINGDGQPELLFTRPKEELALELSQGGRVLSWKIDGFDVVHAEGLHAFAADAFMVPAAFVTGPVQITDLTATDAGIRMRMERVLPANTRGGMAGVKVRREVLVPKTPGQLRIATTIQNTTENGVTFNFRYAGMPALLMPPKDKEGRADLTGPTGAIRYTRNFLKTAFRMAGATKEPKLEAFGMDKTLTIASPNVRFSGTWTPVQIEASVPAEQLYSIVFWDSGAQKCPTTEWVFREVALNPGESWATSMTFRSAQ